MKIPAIRAHIGNWVYYIATLRFKDVSEYVKRVDNELHKSDLLKQMLQRSITNNYKSIANYIETQEERFFNALVLAVYDGVPTWHEVRLEYDDGSEFYNLGILELSGDEKIFPVDGQHRVEGIKKVITAAAETAVRPPLPYWPSWVTPTSTNSAASTPGPMRQSRKVGSGRKRHKICAA